MSSYINELENKLEEISQLKEKIQNDLSQNFKWSTSKEAENKKIKYQNDLENIRNLTTSIYDLEALTNENTEIKAKYDCFNEKIKEICNSLEYFNQEISFENRFLYRIITNPYRTEILVVDIVKNQRTIKFIESEPLLDNGTTIVKLPNYELFCYCNWRHQPWGISGISCIIDLISFKFKKLLPQGPSIRYSGGVYLNKSVYIFGGYDGSKIKYIAKRFDFEKNKWCNIAYLPKESDYCSCVSFKGKILVSGLCHTDIYEYDAAIDSYSEIHVKSLKWRKERILVLGNSRIYIIQWPPAIFESRVNDQYHWRYIGEIKIQPYEFNKGEVNKNAIFIDFKANNNSYFLKFDFKSKTIEELKISDLSYVYQNYK